MSEGETDKPKDGPSTAQAETKAADSVQSALAIAEAIREQHKADLEYLKMLVGAATALFLAFVGVGVWFVGHSYDDLEKKVLARLDSPDLQQNVRKALERMTTEDMRKTIEDTVAREISDTVAREISKPDYQRSITEAVNRSIDNKVNKIVLSRLNTVRPRLSGAQIAVFRERAGQPIGNPRLRYSLRWDYVAQQLREILQITNYVQGMTPDHMATVLGTVTISVGVSNKADSAVKAYATRMVDAFKASHFDEFGLADKDIQLVIAEKISSQDIVIALR